MPALDDAAAAAVERPLGGPPELADVLGRATRRKRTRLGLVAAALIVAGVGLGRAWSAGDPSTTVASAPESTTTVTEVDDVNADRPAAAMRLERIAAIGGEEGTAQVDIRVAGSPPNADVIEVSSLGDAPLDRIAFYLATEDDTLLMCDSQHSWGGATAAVGVTIPAAWFEPATLAIESPIVDGTSADGEPALVAKIITCELASGLWQMTIHGPRAGADAEVSVAVIDGAIRVSIDEPLAEEPVVPTDLWLRREAGVVLDGTLVVPGQQRSDRTKVHFVAMDLATGEEHVLDAPEGLLLDSDSPDWAEPRPILTVWNDRVVVCCAGFSGGAIAIYAPDSDSWAELPVIPGEVRRALVVTERGLLALGETGAVLLDSPTGSWVEVAGPIPDDRAGHPYWTAAALGDHVLLWPVVYARSTELGYLLDLGSGEWRTVPAPDDASVVPAAPSLVVADQRFVVVGGLPSPLGGQSEALVVLPLDPIAFGWDEPSFPLPEPDSFEGNIGSQRLIPAEAGDLVFDTGALGGGETLLEIDPTTGAITSVQDAAPIEVIAVDWAGNWVRRSGG